MMSSNQTTPRMDESDIYDMVDDKECFNDEEYRFIIECPVLREIAVQANLH